MIATRVRLVDGLGAAEAPSRPRTRRGAGAAGMAERWLFRLVRGSAVVDLTEAPAEGGPAVEDAAADEGVFGGAVGGELCVGGRRGDTAAGGDREGRTEGGGGDGAGGGRAGSVEREVG